MAFGPPPSTSSHYLRVLQKLKEENQRGLASLTNLYVRGVKMSERHRRPARSMEARAREWADSSGRSGRGKCGNVNCGRNECGSANGGRGQCGSANSGRHSAAYGSEVCDSENCSDTGSDMKRESKNKTIKSLADGDKMSVSNHKHQAMQRLWLDFEAMEQDEKTDISHVEKDNKEEMRRAEVRVVRDAWAVTSASTSTPEVVASEDDVEVDENNSYETSPWMTLTGSRKEDEIREIMSRYMMLEEDGREDYSGWEEGEEKWSIEEVEKESKGKTNISASTLKRHNKEEAVKRIRKVWSSSCSDLRGEEWKPRRKNTVTLRTEVRACSRSACEKKKENVERVEQERREKVASEMAEMSRQFKANPVPATSVVKLYDNMVKERTLSREKRRRDRSEQLIREQKPFSFQEKPGEGVELKKGKKIEEEKPETEIKAPPKTVERGRKYSANSEGSTATTKYRYSSELEDEYRQLQRKARAKALRDCAKYPGDSRRANTTDVITTPKTHVQPQAESQNKTPTTTSMQMKERKTSPSTRLHTHSCSKHIPFSEPTHKPRINRSVPDFTKLWHSGALTNADFSIGHHRVTTTCKPFRFATQEVLKKHKSSTSLNNENFCNSIKIDNKTLRASVERLSQPATRKIREENKDKSSNKRRTPNLAAAIKEQEKFNLALVGCSRGSGEVVSKKVKQLRKEMREKCRQYDFDLKEMQRKLRNRPLLMQQVGMSSLTLQKLNDTEDEDGSTVNTSRAPSQLEISLRDTGSEVDSVASSNSGTDESGSGNDNNVEEEDEEEDGEKYSPDSGAIPSPTLSNRESHGCREEEEEDKEEADSGRQSGQSGNEREDNLIPSFSDIE